MEKIGDIIRNHRMKKGLTQKELGDKIFVSKQAVSKWETGKTLPDIETVRKLCSILEIDKDEILGGTIKEVRKNRKWLRACILISVISILVALFFGFGGIDYMDRHTQSGIAYLSVFSDGKLSSTDDCQVISDLKYDDLKNGYKFDVGYGEIREKIRLFDQDDIEFGFVNTNNWHNVHIRLDVDHQNGQLSVKQTISYETDHNLYQVTVTEETTTENKISVFREGV